MYKEDLELDSFIVYLCYCGFNEIDVHVTMKNVFKRKFISRYKYK